MRTRLCMCMCISLNSIYRRLRDTQARGRRTLIRYLTGIYIYLYNTFERIQVHIYVRECVCICMCASVYFFSDTYACPSHVYALLQVLAYLNINSVHLFMHTCVLVSPSYTNRLCKCVCVYFLILFMDAYAMRKLEAGGH